MKYIQQIDAFGVPISLTHKEERKFRTKYGGLATLVLYSVCIAYAIYILYLWYIGQILPKVQNQMSTIKSSGVHIEDLLSIGEVQSNYTTDPFSQNNNIILPIMVTYEMGGLKYTPYFSTIQHEGQTRPLVNIKDIDLINNVGDPYNMSSLETQMTDQKLILLVKCNQKLLGDAGTCASQQSIEEYYNMSSIMFDLSIKLKSFNSDSRVFEEFYKTQYIPVDLINTVYSQLYIQTTNIQIDTGLLFQSIESKILMNNYNIFGVSVNEQYNYFEGVTDILTILQFRVDNYQNNQTIVYPKIGEVFAQIGSIVAALLSLKFFFQMLNQTIFEQDLVDQVLSLVYDDYKNIRIKYNMLGQIKNASLNDQYYDEKSFQDFHNKYLIRIQQFMNLSCQISNWIKLEHFLENNAEDHLIMPVRLKNSFSKVYPGEEGIQIQQKVFQPYDSVKIETPT